MKNLFDMMGQFKEMQSKLQELQQTLSDLEVSGVAGGGMVTVTLTGKGEMRGVSIDPSLLKPGEAEILERPGERMSLEVVIRVVAGQDLRARADSVIVASACCQPRNREDVLGGRGAQILRAGCETARRRPAQHLTV